jgi:hypothetical protein
MCFFGQHTRVKPQIISHNGPQFVARDFKTFIQQCGMTHVRTSPYYPQSNGKIERWHSSLKSECIRPGTPLSLEDARQFVNKFVMYYNQVRLHGAIGYVTPKDKLEGQELVIFAERKRKLAAARKRRSLSRSEAEPKAPRQSGRVRIEVAEPCPLWCLIGKRQFSISRGTNMKGDQK